MRTLTLRAAHGHVQVAETFGSFPKKLAPSLHPPPVAVPPSSPKEPVGSSSSSSVATRNPSRGTTAIQITNDGRQIPVSNGGVGPGYWWTQSLSETTVYVEIPATATSRDIVCSILPTKLSVGINGAPLIIDGTLGGTVRPRDCVWNLDTTASAQLHRPQAPTAAHPTTAEDTCKILTIVLEKSVETWWPNVVHGHPEIDATQVDSTQPIDEYDVDTQAAIRKVLFDESQKRKGLPTSDDAAIAATMRAACLAPGSPFEAHSDEDKGAQR